MNRKALHVLLIEDNPADIDLAIEVLADSAVPVDLAVATDGVEALRRLQSATRQSLPDLILLDLNLPGIDGRDVLDRLKQDPKLRRIPVIVLTTSDSDQDIDECYSRGANCFVTKPNDLKRFQDSLNGMVGFWFNVVKLPSGAPSRGVS